MKLKAFIASSSENLNIANALAHNLSKELDCTLWNDGFFPVSATTLETLVIRVDDFDLGLFVFGSDDHVVSREKEYEATRDNVIFEFGLFCGQLGPKKTIIVRSSEHSLKWLTDLDGFTSATYDNTLAATNAFEAVKNACDDIRLVVCVKQNAGYQLSVSRA